MDIQGPFTLKDFSTKSDSTDGFSPQLETEPSSQPVMLNSQSVRSFIFTDRQTNTISTADTIKTKQRKSFEKVKEFT
jgi:hypothetical protein